MMHMQSLREHEAHYVYLGQGFDFLENLRCVIDIFLFNIFLHLDPQQALAFDPPDLRFCLFP